MTYKLAPHVTAEMLEKEGFKAHYDKGYLTSFCRPSKVMAKDNEIENELMVAWDKNCAYDKGIIGMRYNYPPVELEDVQDLIEKGYVIENG
jgi:hypothetical protein